MKKLLGFLLLFIICLLGVRDLIVAVQPAWAQTACTVSKQSTLLALFADNVPAYSITPSNIRDLVCSSIGNDALEYINTSGESISNTSNTTLTGWTKVSDRLNTNFNASTGVYTVPFSGFYHVSAQLYLTATAFVSNVNFQIGVVNNTTFDCIGINFVGNNGTGATINLSASVDCTIGAPSGSTITIQATQSSGGAVTLGTVSAINYVSITQVN